MTKKLFVIVLAMVAAMATGWWYADYSLTKWEENMITSFKEETKEQHHEMRLHMTQEQLWLTYLVDKEFYDNDPTNYDNGMLVIDDLDIMINRCHNGWFEIDGERYMDEEHLNMTAWDIHDVITYGHTLR